MRWRLPNDTAPGVAAGGMLYAYTQNGVSAWEAQLGSAIWSYALPSPIGSVPAIANGVLYVGVIEGNSPPAGVPDRPDTFALDAKTGSLLWRAATGIASGSPVVVGNVMYVGGLGPAMFVLDASIGYIKWRLDTGQANLSTPLAHADLVYFTADGVYAVDGATDAVRWHQTLGATASTFTALPMAHGVLYVGRMSDNGESTLYALTLDGIVLWHHARLNQMSLPVAEPV